MDAGRSPQPMPQAVTRPLSRRRAWLRGVQTTPLYPLLAVPVTAAQARRLGPRERR